MTARLQDRWSEIQQAMLDAAAARSCTQLSIAAAAGVSRGTVARWNCDADPLGMSLRHLLALVEHAGPEVLEPLLRAVGGEEEIRARPVETVAVEATLELAASIAEAQAARADGHVDRRERARLEARAARLERLVHEMVGG